MNASLSAGHLNASCKRSPAASEMTVAAGTTTFAPCLVAAQITTLACPATGAAALKMACAWLPTKALL